MGVCGTLLATSMLGMPVVSAYAAEAAANQDDVLIVTARKREETLLEVPMSIAAFSEKFLEDLRVNSLEVAFPLKTGPL
jgi:iron complex outermembrane recepter protein